jgi:NADPH-dependent 2,4-dienoyl-CoA reductase/sulfur reductase-like enzyme
MKRGIKVNEYLQSVSNPAVYAAGDVAARGGPPLTPVAGYHGRVVAAKLLKGNHLKVNHAAVPTVKFTIPPLGIRRHDGGIRARKGIQIPHHSRDYQFVVFLAQGSRGLLGVQALDRGLSLTHQMSGRINK